MTGLDDEQLTDLVARIHGLCGDKFVSAGRPLALGLFRSVALVVCLIRKNVTQDFAGAVFGVSQATVSRRWDLLRPVIGDVLAEVVPDPRQVVGRGTVLVDGTVCPTWDWAHVPDLFSAKTGYPGMNLQIAATLDGRARRGRPGPRARRPPRRARLRRIRPGGRPRRPPHASPTWATSASRGSTPSRTSDSPAPTSTPARVAFNTALSKARAAVEHAIAHLKTWRMLSEEGGRYRAPLEKYPSMLKAVIGLFFFAAYE